ncbi:metallophosphatase, partial [Candidatus Bipolaricaulota bacterium]|nr:metallophosphatase [Candidatus Bipolaricaulota bacterium]
RSTAAPLTILYTNDLHLRFERLVSLERLIADQREDAGPLLLLDAGDAWHDFRRPTTAVWGADEMVSWMNRVGYDAMALGNHDLYWGPERLAELAERASFPLLCAVLRPIAGSRSPFASTAILQAGGFSVYVVGLATSEYLAFSAFPWLRHVPPVEALRAELARVPEDTDLVIVLAHLPVADAVRIVEAVPGIDVFITGHSHEETPEPVLIGETVIVQSGMFARNLGRLDLDIDAGGRHRVIEHRLIPTEKAPVDSSQGLRQLARVLVALSAILLLVFSSAR